MANTAANKPSTKPKGEIFVIGDIHGCASELRQLLQLLPLDANSTVVFVGDYIDRGPDSKGVIDIILDFRAIYNVITLMGNHEELLLAYIDDPQSRQAGSFIYNGGTSTLASYSQGQSGYSIPEAHLKFFNSLELFYETDNYFIVHAGVPDGDLKKISKERDRATLLWTREKFLKSDYKWKKTVVHGHSVVDKVEIHPNRIAIDTGCVFMGKLSAISLPNQKIYSVQRTSTVPHTYLKDSGTHRVATRFEGQIPVRMQKDGVEWKFETVNYNEFGLLLKQLNPSPVPLFSKLEFVAGEIELLKTAIRKFTGEVVRVDQGADGFRYAIKIQTLEKSIE